MYVCESFLPSKCNRYYIFVCVRACLRVGGRVGMCVGVPRVTLLIQHAMRMRNIVSFVASLAPTIFSTLSHKWNDFERKVIEHKTCVMIFSTNLV
jgi:hypothetical protein